MRILSISALFFLLISCAEKKEPFSKIERLLQENPDSALIQLNQIDLKSLNTKSEQAYWALIKSAALDKNFIDVTSDSLISCAVDYYSKKETSRHKMMAYYYQGVVYKNAKAYCSAIVSFENAENEASILNDFYYLGLIFRGKSEILRNTNDNPLAITYMQKAIACFNKANKIEHALYAQLGLAIDYKNNLDFDAAIVCLNDLKNNPELKVFPDLQVQCTKLEANISALTGQNNQITVDLYNKVPLRYLNLHDCALLALTHDKLGEKEKADYWLSEAYKRCSNNAGKGNVAFIQGSIEAMRGNYESAFLLTRQASNIQDSVTRSILRQSVIEAQRDYYHSEALLQEEKAERLHDRSIVIGLFGLLLFIIGGLFAILKYKEKERKLKEQMINLSIRWKELERIKKNNASLIGALFREKLNHLDALSNSYLQSNDEKEKYLAFKRFKDDLVQMRKDEDLFVSLENNLNKYCNGIMEKLAKQVPAIKGENKKIIMLFFAGLPYDTIQLILNKNSKDSLKTARSRYRKEIKNSDAPDAEEFLEMLEMKKVAIDKSYEKE